MPYSLHLTPPDLLPDGGMARPRNRTGNHVCSAVRLSWPSRLALSSTTLSHFWVLVALDQRPTSAGLRRYCFSLIVCLVLSVPPAGPIASTLTEGARRGLLDEAD